jgi:alkanesulfonate monooxygenase
MAHASNNNPLDLLWFCQLAADGEFIGTKPERRATLPYISSLVETAAEMGFSSLLTATNFHAEHEAWTASIATLARTQGAGLLIAVRPGMFHPALFAKMVATAANLFPGRVRVNVVTGSNPAENAMYGDMENHAERYVRTREFIAIMRELWRGVPMDSNSPLYPFKGAIVSPVPPIPVPIYLGGHSEDAQRISAELADVYLVWGDTIEGVGKRLATMREQEAKVKRLADTKLTYGLRCHVVVRETEDEAWKAAERLISRIDPAVRQKFMETTASVDSEGQKRQLELAASASLVVEPHLWSGVGLARSGVGVAIVGDPSQVAAKLRAYQELGISTFILSGYPHLEECRRFGELVMPILRQGGRPNADSGNGARASATLSTGVAPVT